MEASIIGGCLSPVVGVICYPEGRKGQAKGCWGAGVNAFPLPYFPTPSLARYANLPRLLARRGDGGPADEIGGRVAGAVRASPLPRSRPRSSRRRPGRASRRARATTQTLSPSGRSVSGRPTTAVAASPPGSGCDENIGGHDGSRTCSSPWVRRSGEHAPAWGSWVDMRPATARPATSWA